MRTNCRRNFLSKELGRFCRVIGFAASGAREASNASNKPADLMITLGKYQSHIPTTGGKAGLGKNRTSSIQLREGNRIVKQFRFKTDDNESFKAAARKARIFAGVPYNGEEAR